jgi:pimeloyl-ACP methyl ester carboxylesterase
VATERRIAVGEIDLVVAEAGPGGRPLLLLHGFGGAKEDFTEWLDRLAAAGWHAVAPDHRGHGASSKPLGEASYSLAVMAQDALGLADALGWDRFALLGHSMGGFVAQLVVLEAPQRIAGLVLMDTGHGPIEGIDPAEAQVAIAIAREEGMDRLADVLDERSSPLDTPAHRRLLAERPGYAEFASRKLRATSPDLYAAIVPELIDHPDTLGGLRDLEAVPPTLVVVGEQDAPFVADSQRLAAAIAGATVAVIPEAGHSPQFENPDAWWDALSGFLASLARSA